MLIWSLTNSASRITHEMYVPPNPLLTNHHRNWKLTFNVGIGEYLSWLLESYMMRLEWAIRNWANGLVSNLRTIHICLLTFISSPLTLTVLSRKSTPIVASDLSRNFPEQNLYVRQVFPTSESPTTIILNTLFCVSFLVLKSLVS